MRFGRPGGFVSSNRCPAARLAGFSTAQMAGILDFPPSSAKNSVAARPDDVAIVPPDSVHLCDRRKNGQTSFEVGPVRTATAMVTLLTRFFTRANGISLIRMQNPSFMDLTARSHLLKT